MGRSIYKQERASSIMYHDVVEGDDYASSGWSITGANAYKLDRADFERHLDSIERALPPGSVETATGFSAWETRSPVFLTFDDGGASFYSPIAGLLEQHGWRGHFFITTDWIGKPAFLTAAQLRELDARGHIIGSHSCSHPTRMSACSRDQLQREWSESVRVLAEILGRPLPVASVPGGYYSTAVAETAAAAGIRFLFTSEPSTRVRIVAGCRVLGRFAVKRGMSAHTAAGFAAGRFWSCAGQSLAWKLKSLVKSASAPAYLKARAVLMGDR